MHLTRFQLNPRRRMATKLLLSPQAMHAAVLAGFPDPVPSDDGRVLWRLDRIGHRTLLYIVSPDRPDLTHLVEQAGWPTSSGWESRPYDPLLDRIRNGERYGFRLTANPVHNVRVDKGRRGKPLGHVTVAQQEQWLIDRQGKAGFDTTGPEGEPPTLLVSERRTLEFSRKDSRVTLRVASYTGVLTVTDRERFIDTLTHGLGRAKGYGCGLLTIAPAR